LLFAQQIKAGRALLGWDQQELARASNVGIATVRRIEGVDGPIKANTSTTWRLQEALEKAGIIFIDPDEKAGPGVRLATPTRGRGG
jgi:transcriptional regulator with XRE-family HTH domain